MNSVLRLCPVRRQIKFIQHKLVCLRVFFQPFSDSDLKGICVDVIKYSSSWLILICSYVWALAIIMILLFPELLLPYILEHLGAGDSAISPITEAYSSSENSPSLKP